MENLAPQGFRRITAALRVGGPLLLLGGMALGLLGMTDFIEAADHGRPPDHYWALFAGIGVGFAGLVLCQVGYAREILALFGFRLKSRPPGPVQTPVRLVCPHCGGVSGPEANFCAECGTALPLPPLNVLPTAPGARREANRAASATRASGAALCVAALMAAAACSAREPTPEQVAAVRADFERQALPLVAAQLRGEDTLRIELILDPAGRVEQFLLRLPRIEREKHQALNDQIVALGLRAEGWPGERVYLKFSAEEVRRARPAVKDGDDRRQTTDGGR